MCVSGIFAGLISSIGCRPLPRHLSEYWLRRPSTITQQFQSSGIVLTNMWRRGEPKAAPANLPEDSKSPAKGAEAGIVDPDGKGDNQRYDKIDKELAQYIAEDRVPISKERSDELRKKIDRRVLVVMISTYFLQAIDKGTLSFSSIMGLPKDTGMVDENDVVTQDVCLIKDPYPPC